MKTKIIKTEKITRYKWLNLFKSTFISKGKRSEWIFASRNKNAPDTEKTSAVLIVPSIVDFNGTKKIVIIKEFRIPLGDYELSFPAGLLDDGEDVIECAKRELFEETGLSVITVKSVSPRLFSSAGMTDESIQYVFVEASGELTNSFNETTEDIEVIAWDYSQVAAFICTEFGHEQKMGAKTWPILYAITMAGKI